MKVDNASTFGGIETGVNVDIKRSDGRIHSAIVTELKFESRTVSVEWFENNETKGKLKIFPALTYCKPSNYRLY